MNNIYTYDPTFTITDLVDNVVFSDRTIEGVYAKLLAAYHALPIFINGHIPFGMELTTIGPFINWQLIGLFILNLVINVLEIYRCKKCDEAIHWGWFISIATMYLTVFYGDLLHRMDSTQGAIESLMLRTVVVVIVTGTSWVVAKVLKIKKQQKIHLGLNQ